MNEKNAVAQTILQQLGGRRFCVMTGAKNFVGTPQSLTFSLPTGSTRNKANTVRVTLTPTDDYLVQFFAIRGATSKERGAHSKGISTHEGIYADQLADLIAVETGLALTL